MFKILIYIFNVSTLFLIIISLWPGSLIGYLLYSDWGQQLNLITNPFGTTVNHFLAYIYVSLLGLFIYIKSKNFNKILYSLVSLSIILELLHYIIPNRSFQLGDLIGNILGVTVAYFIVKIYLYFSKQ